MRLLRCREGLQVVRKRRKRRLLGTTTQQVKQAGFPNQVWGYVFCPIRPRMPALLKSLMVVGGGARQGAAVRVERSSLTASDVIHILDDCCGSTGTCIRDWSAWSTNNFCSNEPEQMTFNN